MVESNLNEAKAVEFENSLQRVLRRWASQPPSKDPVTIAALIAFGSQLEFFSAFNCAPGRLVARAAILRAMLEVLADIAHIQRDASKQAQRALDYVKSANDLRPAMLEAALALKVGTKGKSMRQLTNWTSSSVDDRLNAITPSMAHLYDVLSYCSHAHPGKVWLFGNSPEEGPMPESYLRRLAYVQMYSVASRAGDMGVLESDEIRYIDEAKQQLDALIE